MLHYIKIDILLSVGNDFAQNDTMLVITALLRIQSLFPLLKVLKMTSLGYWDIIGSSGAVCIHTFQLPDDRLLCVERPHERPVNRNNSDHTVPSKHQYKWYSSNRDQAKK